MAYGDYDGPDKPDKGKEGGSCNRARCQASPAGWFNHGSLAWYCLDCRIDIQFDAVNHQVWQAIHDDRPMFENREMINARQAESQ